MMFSLKKSPTRMTDSRVSRLILSGMVLLSARVSAAVADYSSYKTPAEIYAGYQQAKKTAEVACKRIESDKALQKRLNSWQDREKNGVRKIIEGSPAAQSDEVKTLLLNFDYFTFELNENMEMVWDLPVRKWVLRVESMGMSDEGWKLRQEYLDSFMPDIALADYAGEWTNFDAYIRELKAASALYTTPPYRKLLQERSDAMRKKLTTRLSKRQEEERAAGLQVTEYGWVRGWLQELELFSKSLDS